MVPGKANKIIFNQELFIKKIGGTGHYVEEEYKEAYPIEHGADYMDYHDVNQIFPKKSNNKPIDDDSNKTNSVTSKSGKLSYVIPLKICVSARFDG